MATILLVEDDTPLLNLYAGALSASHTVLTAGSVQEALDHLAQHCPDLLILDLNLPDAPGSTLLKVMERYAHLYKVRVLVMTGFSRLQARKLPPNVSEMLAKPVTTLALLRKVEALLDQPHQSEV